MPEKEIWKLLELLNEYENRDDDPQIEWRIWEWDKWEKWKIRWIVNDVYMWWVSELVVCSAYYGFIQRLVEQDKIDRDKFEIEYIDKQTLNDVYIAWAKKDELLIMLLSINEQPIELLISILK